MPYGMKTSLVESGATNFLIEKITESLDIVAPIETKTMNVRHDNHWVTPGIAISLKQQAKLFKKHKPANNPTIDHWVHELQKYTKQGERDEYGTIPT